MLNNEQAAQSEASAIEALPGDVSGDLEKSATQDVSQPEPVDNEQTSVSAEEADEPIPYETKQQWRKREKKLVSERDQALKEAAQLANIMGNFVQPNGNAQLQSNAAQPSANKPFKEQMAEYERERAVAKIKQDHDDIMAEFSSRWTPLRENDDKVEEGVTRLGHYVSEAMLNTLAYLAPSYESEKFLAHLLANDTAELKRISSLPPAHQTRELTEKAYQFRASRVAKKSNAPAPAKQGIKNYASPQVDINKRSIEEHKAAIRERDRRRNPWQIKS